MEEIAKIVDEPHSDGSDSGDGEPKVAQTEAPADDGTRVRGGSIIETDDAFFGENALGRKRGNSAEGNRPRPR